jgi:hypothetical protein
MNLVHVELEEANEFIAAYHRHHKPVRGHRFSLGCADWLGLAGVVIVGRPVSRGFDARKRVEVTRLCTDGTPNACSFLYSAAARAAKALGYAVIGTYILASESGTSLKATGWTQRKKVTRGRDWNGGKRTGRRTDQPQEDKTYWFKELTR